MGTIRFCNWSELGVVTRPGDYNLYHVGTVHVDQGDIDIAEQQGGNIRFGLVEVAVAPDGKPTYRLERRR